MADEKEARAQRLAEALRANLRRRKSQTRARDADMDGVARGGQDGPAGNEKDS